MVRRNTQQAHGHPTTMAGDDAQRNRERDEMAKTDHRSTRDLHTKESKASYDPLSYRVLLMMSQIYKKWAAMRLKQSSPWIQRWRLPQMYAGVPGLCLEYWRSRQTTGGATDIYKSFDEIVRPLSCMTARVAGIPSVGYTGMPFLDDFHCSVGPTMDNTSAEEQYRGCLLTTFTSLPQVGKHYERRTRKTSSSQQREEESQQARALHS